MRVQPLIGATAGLVTLFVLETGAVELGAKQTASWAALALFTFVAGFRSRSSSGSCSESP
jgi:hypothetical protein